MERIALRTSSGGARSGRQPWWQREVLYQVYVRSFADSDGDGVGDLRGIVERLDYLEWLGVRAIWLSPVTVSPDRDWGYDVADYTDVQPVFGGLSALDELVAATAACGIEVILDLVRNHTSDLHPWFQEARSSRGARRRDWYVWADPRSGGAPPNNWRSSFGGAPAWTLDEHTGQYYLHNFLPQLRDNPDPAVSTYNANREDVHEVFRRWRKVVDEYRPERILLGETWVMELARLARFYGAGSDELHLAFNFPFALSELDADTLRSVVDATEAALPEHAWPVWMLSNHDLVRFRTRMCGGDERKARALLLLLLTLRGTPVLYYGDELGMPQARVPRRASSPDLVEGGYESLPAPAGVWAFRRGEHTAVAANLSDEPAVIDCDGPRELEPWGAIIVDV